MFGWRNHPTDVRQIPDQFFLLFAAAIGILSFVTTLLYFYRAPVFDDAFITATFARNLAHGHGLTWTPGDAAFYGPTSLPFTLLLALAERVGLDGLDAARWLGALGWGVAHACLFLVAITFLSEAMAAVATIWSAVMLIGPRWSVGMESGLYVAAIMAILLAVQSRSWRAAFALAVTAAAIRPDGLIMLGVVSVALLCRSQLPWRSRVTIGARAAWPALAAGLIVAAAIVAVLGTVVPNSLTAKRAFPCDVAGCLTPFGLFDALVASLGLGTATFLSVFAIAGVVRLLAARAWGAWPLLFCALAYLAIFTVARAPGSVWYYAPLAPAIVLCAAYGITGPWPFRSPIVRWIGALSLVVAAALTTRAVLARPQDAAKDGVDPPRAMVTDRILGDMAARKAATASVLSFEVGYLGYRIPGKVIDLLGVVTPGLQPCLHDEDGADVLTRFAPDYVVVIDQPYVGTYCIVGAPGLAVDYTLLARVSRDFGYYMDNYLVYRRR